MQRTFFTVLTTAFILFLLPAAGLSQIQLIPTTIVLDRSGVGTVMVINTTNEPREISISTDFKYNMSNETGQSVDAGDYSELEMYDISENLLIYPPRFVLGGGERRDVRVQHRMGPGMEDGGYFSRFMVKAEPMARDAVQEDDPESIGVQLNYVFVQDIPLYHFYGNATTGIVIKDMKVIEDEGDPEYILFLFDMEKTGNSPYRGSVDIVIRDGEGEVIDEETKQVGLFTDRKIGLKIPKERYSSDQTYTADFTFKTKRSTSAPQDLVQAPDVTWSTTFSIQE
ncbi:MAG: hypothetical protein RI575_15135 [Balneolaceae bacterium]|nr:hypothetical protein [Balneolaceae bacterium]MDR9408289.1 hypothetical protein [Balneolaceae bacterium]